jgi:hypothetical protein
MIDDLDIDEDV